MEIDYRVQARPEGVAQAFQLLQTSLMDQLRSSWATIFFDSGEIRRMVSTFRGGASTRISGV